MKAKRSIIGTLVIFSIVISTLIGGFHPHPNPLPHRERASYFSLTKKTEFIPINLKLET